VLLWEIQKPVTELKGIGKQKTELLSKLGIFTISDLLMHYPRGYENRKKETPFTLIKSQGYIVTVITVLSHQFFGFGKKRTLKISVKDDTGRAELICFGRNFLADKLKVGEKFFLAGDFSMQLNGLQSSRFEVEPWSETPQNFNTILPLYPLTSELTHNFFRSSIAQAIQLFNKTIEDELDKELLKKYKLLPIQQAIEGIHSPNNENQIKDATESLKFRELYQFQLRTARARKKREEIEILPLHAKLSLQQNLISSLPFSLTKDQKRAIEEINNDLLATRPMGRLLQGDVGSGKTLVALSATLLAIASGKQAAIMVPTELLAQQHAQKIAELVEPLGVRPALLTGSVAPKPRNELLKALASGEIDIIVGTHALFSQAVEFKSLGIVVIDEQHKFGVHQRELMRKKGGNPHLLLMSATPIPRTLAMTLYGDLEVTEIKTLPHNRKKISTHLTLKGNEHKVYQRVLNELQKGHQAYIVYPQIEADKEKPSPLKNVMEAWQMLSTQWFSNYQCAIIHSEIEESEKEEIMGRFSRKEIAVLFATTVVEVGIDNPNATVIVIEDAQQFGLATLHQLRGRVGRSSLQSYCYLIYGNNLSEKGKERLITMKESCDGFEISQKDLELRGAGELLGARQSGEFRLNIANPLIDEDILKKATEAAKDKINKEERI